MNASCSHALPIRITDSPLSLTAGGMATPAPLGAAILSLAEGKRTPLLTGLPGYRPIVMRLTWADMSVPALSRDDWEWLAARLTALPTKRLHIHCQAGHGRTGTTLAILCTLWGCVPEGQCPVTWVRAVYCQGAVETQAQLDYVAKVTGRPVSASPAMPAYTPPATGGSYTGYKAPQRDLYRDPYADDDYFGTGRDRDLPPSGTRFDLPPRGTTLRRDRNDRPEARYDPKALRRSSGSDSLGSRRARYERYFPGNASAPADGAPSAEPTPKADAPGESPTATFPAPEETK